MQKITVEFTKNRCFSKNTIVHFLASFLCLLYFRFLIVPSTILMKTIYLVIIFTIIKTSGFAQSFTYPASGRADSTSITAEDGVSMYMTIAPYGKCPNGTSNSLSFAKNHVSIGALYRGSTYATNCKGSFEIIKLDFTKVTKRPAGMQFGIYDVDNNSDSVSIRIFSGSTSVNYTYALYSPTFINAYGTSPDFGFAGTVQNNSGLDDNRGTIDIATVDPFVTVDSILIYKYNNRDMAGGPSQSYSRFNWNTRSTLPVKLTSFSATHNGNLVQFNWKAAEEEGTKNYQIEYSTNGVAYFPTGNSIKAKGTDNGDALYAYSVPLPSVANVLYFRLKSTDVDGKIFYSKTINVAASNNTLSTAYPTVFIRNFSISVQSTTNNKGTIKLIGLDGMVCYQKNIVLEKGLNVIPVEITQNIPAGIYALNGEFENGASFKHKLVKQ